MLQPPEDKDQIRFLKAARKIQSRRVQEEISEKTGISTSNVSEYLNCIKFPSRSFLSKFYNAFGIIESELNITDSDIAFVDFVKENKFKKRGEFKPGSHISSDQQDRDRFLVLSQLSQIQRILVNDLNTVSTAMWNLLSSKSGDWKQNLQVVEDLVQKYNIPGKGRKKQAK